MTMIYDPGHLHVETHKPDPAPFYYERIFFAQGEEADELLEYIDEHGEEKALDYACETYDMGDGGDIMEGPSHGSSDWTFTKGRHTLSYNNGIGYVGLERKLTRGEQFEWNGTKPDYSTGRNEKV